MRLASFWSLSVINLHAPFFEDWVLRLKSPSPSDSGQYECQVSTTPHSSLLLNLTVKGRNDFFSIRVLRSA